MPNKKSATGCEPMALVGRRVLALDVEDVGVLVGEGKGVAAVAEKTEDKGQVVLA